MAQPCFKEAFSIWQLAFSQMQRMGWPYL